ncbi:MAG: flagellar filament capping protein FliD [Comamonadaceae bacterium]|nr:flagellar filament capping protein FliD [Comamonadaceae bacterium]
MATITSVGIGSGLDVKSIVSQLVALEKKPLDKLKLDATMFDAKISAYGQIKSLFSTLSSAASSLNSLTTWNAVTATSSNSTAVTASAVGGTLATEFSVGVTSLAEAQSTASQSFTAGTKPGAGTLSIQLGYWSDDGDGPTFTAGTATAKTIAVNASDKISDIASKINGANAGVSATVMNDPATGGERLLLRSTTTGKATGFVMTVTDNTTPGQLADNTGLSRLVDTAQSTASQSFTAATTPGAGTLSIQLGSWSAAGDTFTAGTATAKTIAVDTTDKISDIASKINGANAGVNATVMTDTATGQERLLLRSTTPGAATGFQMTVTDDAGDTTPSNLTDNTGLSQLVFETVPGDTMTQLGTTTTTMTQLGTNAKATLNGVAIESASNTFTNVVSGVSFTALQTTTSAATIKVSRDNSAITTSIQAFVDAYNKINETMADATKYDAVTKEAGMFQGDAAANGLLSAMRRMLQSVTDGGAFSRLADVGIVAQRGGNLGIDSAKLSTALSSKFTDIKNLFKAEASPAMSQSTASQSLAAGPIGAGTLSITMGSWDFAGGTFTPGSVAAVPITVVDTDTIADIASKINGAGAGVRAEVKTDPTTGGQRLLLSSTSTGKEAGFQMTVTDEDGVSLPATNLVDNTGLSSLVFETKAGGTMTQLATNGAPTDGVAVRFKKFSDGLLATDGLFSSKDATLKRSLVQNSKNQETVNDRVNRFETQLNAKYSALDAKMASLSALNAYVAQQVTTWNKSTG